MNYITNRTCAIFYFYVMKAFSTPVVFKSYKQSYSTADICKAFYPMLKNEILMNRYSLYSHHIFSQPLIPNAILIPKYVIIYTMRKTVKIFSYFVKKRYTIPKIICGCF